MANDQTQSELSPKQTWSAVGSMALCVALLIASEFMPVSLLTPIARDLRATEGMAGQAISISGLFAVATSLFIATVAGRFDRRRVLMGMTGLMLLSLVIIAISFEFAAPLVSAGTIVATVWISRAVESEGPARFGLLAAEVPRILGVTAPGVPRVFRIRA